MTEGKEGKEATVNIVQLQSRPKQLEHLNVVYKLIPDMRSIVSTWTDRWTELRQTAFQRGFKDGDIIHLVFPHWIPRNIAIPMRRELVLKATFDGLNIAKEFVKPVQPDSVLKGAQQLIKFQQMILEFADEKKSDTVWIRLEEEDIGKDSKDCGNLLMMEVGMFRSRCLVKCDAPKCPNKTLKFCGGCKTKAYCSRDCQRGDWQNHAPHCKKEYVSCTHTKATDLTCAHAEQVKLAQSMLEFVVESYQPLILTRRTTEAVDNNDQPSNFGIPSEERQDRRNSALMSVIRQARSLAAERKRRSVKEPTPTAVVAIATPEPIPTVQAPTAPVGAPTTT